MTKLSSILDQIDAGSMLLPEFQRGYVWNRDQVRGLMRSLYRGYPVGALLIWETEPAAADVRGQHTPSSGAKQLLLDGQQRITTLYGVIRGRAPAFFEGDATAFTGLRFNLETEVFEFYFPTKMKDDPLWIDVTELFVGGLEPHIRGLSGDSQMVGRLPAYITRLSRLHALGDRDFHAEKITGTDKTIDHVVDIFNKVNSGGTKLSKGDLALAKICADWPEARGALRGRLDTWQSAGYRFTLDWLLRNVTAVATGRAQFESLEDVTTREFQESLHEATKYVGAFLDLVAGRLGLDHDRVLLARYAVPVATRLQHLHGGDLGSTSDQDRLLFWYIHAGLWGRFAGSTETFLNRDYEVAQASGIGGLIDELERWRGGNLSIGSHDFNAFGVGSRFYPLLYLMTRVLSARDFGTGIELRRQLLGHLSSLQVHHIFPKSLLYKPGAAGVGEPAYSRGEVNSVANFCFLTQQTNLSVGSRRPQDYLPEIEEKHPGALASQWIPMDERLWRIENYRTFLEARQTLLADAANGFLRSLRDSTLRVSEPLERVATIDPVQSDDDLAAVRELASEFESRGMVAPTFDVEIPDPESGEVIAVAEAFWEKGLQPGQGNPVVLELDPEPSGLTQLESIGYSVFTSVDALRDYVARQLRESSGDSADEVASASGHRWSDPEVKPDEGEVRRRFGQAMQSIYARARKEAGYNPTAYLDMLHRHGAHETARRLLHAPTASAGYVALYERGRLDLTVENVALRPEFGALFTEEERDIARRRLAEFGFTPES